jgi:hypothetical protein
MFDLYEIDTAFTKFKLRACGETALIWLNPAHSLPEPTLCRLRVTILI